MGLSLSVLMGLCLLLPGAAFVLGFARMHRANSPPTPLDEHFGLGLVVAMIVALAFQALWLRGLDAMLLLSGLPRPSVSQFGALLAGDAASANGAAALSSLQQYPLRISGYFLGVTFFAWITGRVLNKRLHRRASASWFDLLRPEDADMVWLTAEVHMDGCCFLFGGIAVEFSVDRNGDLERVVLESAVKRPLKMDGPPPANAVYGHWTEVPGEFLVLQVKDVKTINVDYFFET